MTAALAIGSPPENIQSLIYTRVWTLASRIQTRSTAGWNYHSMNPTGSAFDLDLFLFVPGMPMINLLVAAGVVPSPRICDLPKTQGFHVED